MKPFSYILVAVLFSFGGFIAGRKLMLPQTQPTPEVIKKIIERPMDKYNLENLRTTAIAKSPITIEKEIDEDKESKEFTSYLFSHNFDPTMSGGKNKKVTGMINVPKTESPEAVVGFPLVIMFRGYVDQSIYTTGVGSRPAATALAKEGFMTIAPDFLGYGESSEQSGKVLEARFQAYTTALSILGNIDSLENWDKKNIFIWGHSNGGLIALTTLELTSLPIPTVLWAPVSKPFPYSVLYYTDESEDKGKFLRREIADFESLYDAEKYSFDNYLSNVTAPIQFHQGTADDAIPAEWTSSLAAKLKKQELEIEAFTYPGADHNMRPSWDIVMERSIAFLKKHMQ